MPSREVKVVYYKGVPKNKACLGAEEIQVENVVESMEEQEEKVS